ncbi:MAG: protein translocase subunit SecF, partial [Rhodospirillales bacterium]
MRLRFIPDHTNYPFMRGRFAGLGVSFLLSVISVVLFFYPGLNYGPDFKGGIVVEARFVQPADFPALRGLLGGLGVGNIALQEFGSPNDVRIRMERQGDVDVATTAASKKVTDALQKAYPDVEIRRASSIGASISGEQFQSGMIAMGLALIAMLIYIWFRFEWQFGIGAIATLVL